MENTFISIKDEDLRAIQSRYTTIYSELKQIEATLYKEADSYNRIENKKSFFSFFKNKRKDKNQINVDKISFYFDYIGNIGNYLTTNKTSEVFFNQDLALEKEYYHKLIVSNKELHDYFFVKTDDVFVERKEFIFFLFYLLGKQISFLNQALNLNHDKPYTDYSIELFSFALQKTNLLADFLLTNSFDFIVENYQEFYQKEQLDIKEFRDVMHPTLREINLFQNYFQIGQVIHLHTSK